MGIAFLKFLTVIKNISKSVLIFDVFITGHHVEYLNHLFNFLVKNNYDTKYYFIVHPSFTETIKKNSQDINASENVFIHPITEAEYVYLDKGSMIKKSFKAFNILNKYAMIYNVDEVILMYFNTFQLALGLKRTSYKIKGILFLQFNRMITSNWKEKLKYVRKYFTTLLYTKNKNVNRVFLLNDTKGASELNNKYRTDIFKSLNDPIPDLVALNEFDIYRHYKIAPKSRICLHIGGLGVRKGTIELIKAMGYLEDDKNITLLLIGKTASNAEKKLIHSEIQKIQQISKIKIIWDHNFIQNSMMKSVFNQCDIVVLPYKNVEASSGIIGHAAKSNKIVIVPDAGLLGEIVRKNHLGILLSSTTPEAIAQSINSCDNFIYDIKASKLFTQYRTPKAFAKEILSEIA